MKERPILFSGAMVRAILKGQKTVTRRAVKGDQIPTLGSWEGGDEPRWSAVGQHHPRYGFCVFGDTEEECAKELGLHGACPYGKPGDRLWVRESWAADAQVDAIAPRDLSEGEPIMYPADGAIRQTGCAMVSQGKGRPSIHMPRWVSRILLEITAVRVERLQDISLQQVRAEGCEVREFWLFGADNAERQRIGARVFGNLWSSINGSDSWAANPWVWVVEFKRVTP